jgi:hypothetical protein
MRVQGPGAVAANLYQGIRSEYLSQYVFSMFGTVTRVPNEEDHGVDLVCTLTRKAGGRAEPFAYYSVQVKSAPGEWVFGGPGSVRWILEYPAPLLFCAAEKKAARFTIYQLTARFQAALIPERPDRLTLVPGEAGTTEPVHQPRVGWDAAGRLELGPPILQFTVDELLDDRRFGLFSSILEYWVLNDLRNILRQQMGMQSASRPSYYATNEVPPPFGFGTFSMAVVPPEIRERASRTAAEHLDWLGNVMQQSGDATGALLAALMIRHLVPGEDPDRQVGFHPSWLYGQLSHIARKAFPEVTASRTVTGPLDAILAELAQRIQDGETGTRGHET